MGAKPLSKYLEVKGYGETAEWVYTQAHATREEGVPLLPVREVRRVHYEVMAPVWAVAPHPDATAEEIPGNFRQHDIRAFAGGMTPATGPLVPAEISAWVERVNHSATELTAPAPAAQPMPELLARLHVEFEKIHPFIDGNGRAGRLLLNLTLVRLGLPPVIILKQQRPAYLAALEAADRGEDGALGELLARAMLDNINRFVLPNVAGPARLVPLPSLADQRISLTALRAAARADVSRPRPTPRGEWLSSRPAVDEYLASRSTVAAFVTNSDADVRSYAGQQSRAAGARRPAPPDRRRDVSTGCDDSHSADPGPRTSSASNSGTAASAAFCVELSVT